MTLNGKSTGALFERAEKDWLPTEEKNVLLEYMYLPNLFSFIGSDTKSIFKLSLICLNYDFS